MIRSALSFELFNGVGAYSLMTGRDWGSINPFTSYEWDQRLASGLGEGVRPCDITDRIVFPEEIHGARCHECVASDGGSIRLGVDAVITSARGPLLAVFAADCVPVAFVDKRCRAIGLAHAGRKGIEAGIIGNCLSVLATACGVQAHELLVGIGPSIRSCCYSVGQDALVGGPPAMAWSDYASQQGDGFMLDLHAALIQILAGLGVPVDQIEDVEICSACSAPGFFSARSRQADDERGASNLTMVGFRSPVE